MPQGTKRCHLEWDHSERWTVLAGLEVLVTYFQDPDECQQLMRCKACGQLYFCDFQDVTRYFDYNGMQDHVLIPVKDAADAELLFHRPRSQRDTLKALVMIWPPDEAKPFWRNR